MRLFASHATPKIGLSDVPINSLAFALDGAAQILLSVGEGRSLSSELKNYFIYLSSKKYESARGAIQSIVYKSIRQQGASHYLIQWLLRKSPPKYIQAFLQCVFALLLEEPLAYKEFTIVDQAVLVIANKKKYVGFKGLINAVLRQFLRQRKEFIQQLANDPVAFWNYPQWWISAVKEAYPDNWQFILEAGNRQGPLTLRVNRRHLSVEQYLKILQEQGIEATQIGKYALKLKRALSIEHIPGFAQGWVSVQDAGAQLAVEQLTIKDGMRVLDACAAPGGKSGHILEYADVNLTALEIDPRRVQKISENLERLKLHAKVCVGDAKNPKAWFDGQLFDRILADVPCSASGIVRRHPDIRWLRRKSDVSQFVKVQRLILLSLWSLLKPKGELVYVTCSIFPEEGEAQAEWFVNRCPDAVRLPSLGQLIPTVSEHNMFEQDHDGFFYARFLKQ